VKAWWPFLEKLNKQVKQEFAEKAKVTKTVAGIEKAMEW
jgi:hypothetical protein